MIRVNNNNFTSFFPSFPIFIPFISFSCLLVFTNAFRTMLNSSMYTKFLSLFLKLMGIHLMLSHRLYLFSLRLSPTLLYYALYCWDEESADYSYLAPVLVGSANSKHSREVRLWEEGSIFLLSAGQDGCCGQRWLCSSSGDG